MGTMSFENTSIISKSIGDSEYEITLTYNLIRRRELFLPCLRSDIVAQAGDNLRDLHHRSKANTYAATVEDGVVT